ncbi:C-type lectin protein [Ochromonadaceae sp. CCMP2298]|nr:C-type lectin protein [Ochromonadaceae sp. CCMP2298]
MRLHLLLLALLCASAFAGPASVVDEGGPVDGSQCGCAVGSQAKESDFSRAGSVLRDLPLLNTPEGVSVGSSESEVVRALNEKMVFIPAGVGYMGTDSPWMRLDGESPRRRVRLSPYYLDKYEVSNADFQSFVLETNFTTESELFGWSFVFAPAVPAPLLASIEQAVQGAQWWVPVDRSNWLYPEGRLSAEQLAQAEAAAGVGPGKSVNRTDACSLGESFRYLLGRDVFSSGRGEHPVVHVSHNDAQSYCAWRNTGKMGTTGNTGESSLVEQGIDEGRMVVRLPSEAEWEHAANGPLAAEGAGGADAEAVDRAGRLYPWGEKFLPSGAHRANIFQGRFPQHNSEKDGFAFTAPVTAYGAQNGYGLYNMVGNVWEWVLDRHTVHHTPDTGTAASIPSNPSGPATGEERVKKGGSFMCQKSFCYRYRNAARYPSTPDSATYNIGFRCARGVPLGEGEDGGGAGGGRGGGDVGGGGDEL